MGESSARYGRFARYYDFLYEDIVDYAGDVAFLETVFRRWMRNQPQCVLDLGCGTGNHDVILARRGYEVTGLDLSPAQLAVARRKARREGLRVHFIHGDMRSFDLGRTFDVCACMFGAFGYLLRSTDVRRCLKSVHRHLRPGGLFVFEFWQSSAARPAGYQSWLHKVGSEYEIVRLSESRFDARTRILPIEFRFFVFRAGRMLDRFDETHTVRTYETDRLKDLLREAGLDPLALYAATPQEKGFHRVRGDTFRIMAVARRRARDARA